MISKVRTTLLESAREMEAATVALFRNRTDCSGDGEGCGSLREGVKALVQAGPPATLLVRATFDWGDQEKYFDATDGGDEHTHVMKILEYFTVQNVRKS